jgi:hypothetical protein
MAGSDGTRRMARNTMVATAHMMVTAVKILFRAYERTIHLCEAGALWRGSPGGCQWIYLSWLFSVT